VQTVKCANARCKIGTHACVGHPRTRKRYKSCMDRSKYDSALPETVINMFVTGVTYAGEKVSRKNDPKIVVYEGVSAKVEWAQKRPS
jgi:hypothetical protein